MRDGASSRRRAAVIILSRLWRTDSGALLIAHLVGRRMIVLIRAPTREIPKQRRDNAAREKATRTMEQTHAELVISTAACFEPPFFRLFEVVCPLLLCRELIQQSAQVIQRGAVIVQLRGTCANRRSEG